jgi:tetratricopeptide (TPR) repeat protein
MSCGKKPEGTGVPDAQPSARLTLTPPSAKDEHEVHDRPLVPCPIADKYDLDAALDQSAARYDGGDYNTALACAEQAARIAPRSVEAHHDRAAALSALERWEESKQAFTMALALDPDDAETLAGAAHLYVNRLGPARDLTLIGLEYARRGSAHVGRRRGDRQLAARLALLESQALDDLGHPDEALNAAESAIVLDPSSVEAKYERAVALFHMCRFDKARPAFEEVLRHEADDPFAHHHLGLILEREGRFADADKHLRRATELAPDKFAAPVILSAEEFQKLVDDSVRALDPETRKLMGLVAIEIADLPALEDLTAVDPPFAPTILGLYRGAPVEGGAKATRPVGEPDEPRAIVLYRKNLGRAVTTRSELEKQVRITLLHEIGHLRGEDEDELRARGLE